MERSRERRQRQRWWSLVLVTVVGLVAATACDVPGGRGGSSSSTSSTSTTVPPAIRYAALGDSFSSGEGAPPYDSVSGKCDRSDAAWPRRLDHDVAVITRLDHRACAGAKTAHLTGPWASRGLPAQIPETPDGSIDLVTLTIGGNDVGFSDIVQQCVLSDCPSPQDPAFATALATLSTTLRTQVYPALLQAYPNARIAHLGYPYLTPPTSRRPVACGWLPPTDQAAAIGIVDAIDATVQAAADATPGITYVDVTSALQGHELCSATPWVRPIISQGAVHPTSAGQRALELRVADVLGLAL
jgi:lysophospholipase L1-like esterase